MAPLLIPPLSTKQNWWINPKSRGKQNWMENFLIWRKSTRKNHWGKVIVRDYSSFLLLPCKLSPNLVIYFALSFVGQRFRRAWAGDSYPLGVQGCSWGWRTHFQVGLFTHKFSISMFFGPSVSTGHVLCQGFSMWLELFTAWWYQDSCPSSMVAVFQENKAEVANLNRQSQSKHRIITCVIYW